MVSIANYQTLLAGQNEGSPAAQCGWNEGYLKPGAEAELQKYRACVDRWYAEKNRRKLAIDKAKAERREHYAVEARAREEARAALPSPTIGMTDDQVKDETNWGPADHINRTTTANGTDEQWVYSISPHSGDYLYFRNEILTGIQEHNPQPAPAPQKKPEQDTRVTAAPQDCAINSAENVRQFTAVLDGLHAKSSSNAAKEAQGAVVSLCEAGKPEREAFDYIMSVLRGTDNRR